MNMWSEFHKSGDNIGLFLEQDFQPEFESTSWDFDSRK